MNSPKNKFFDDFNKTFHSSQAKKRISLKYAVNIKAPQN